MSEYSQETANPSDTSNGGGPTADHQWVLLDDPIPGVRRITFNRANKRNSLIHPLRGAILGALRDADNDDDIKVSIVRVTARPFPPDTTSPAATPTTNCRFSPLKVKGNGHAMSPRVG